MQQGATHQQLAGKARPRPLPEILETAGHIYRERMAELYTVAAIAFLTAWTINLITRVWAIEGVPLGALEDPRTPQFFRTLGHLLAAAVANGLVYALLNSVAGAIVTVIVAADLGDRRPSLAEGVRRAASRFAPVLGATLLYFLAMAALIGLAGVVASVPAAGGLMMGLAGGAAALALGVIAALTTLAVLAASGLVILYLSLRFALYAQVAVLEGAGALESLRRSMRITREDPGSRLVDRYLFRAAVLMFALVLLQVVVGTIGGVPEYGVGLVFGEPATRSEVSIINPTGMPLYLLIPLEILSVLLSAAVLPYGTAVFVLLYLDVRGRVPETPSADLERRS